MNLLQLVALWEQATKTDDGETMTIFWETPNTVLEKFTKLVLKSQNHFNDVKQFQTKFGHIVNETPVHLTKRKLLERIKFLQEELDEFTEACGFERRSWIAPEDTIVDHYEVRINREIGAEVDQDLPLQADALVDIIYVALGTAVMMGLPWQQLWDDVHYANMKKVRGIGTRSNLVDCIKPPGWQGPKTLEILISAGYNPDHQINIGEHRDDIEHMQKTDNI